MISENAGLAEQAHFVTGFAPGTPSTTTPDYVSMKDYSRCTILIVGDNATTVTGSAITVKQATAVAGTSEKAVSFSYQWANSDTAASDVLTKTAVTSDTFTTVATNAKNYLHVIDVSVDDLDLANGFDCIRAGTGDAVATVLAVVYILWPRRYANDAQRTAITD